MRSKFSHCIRLAFLVVISMLCAAVAASADNTDNETRRYAALLISVLQFENGWPDLSYKFGKVEQLSIYLKKYNYQVSRIVNPGHKSLRTAVNKFIDDHKKTDETLLIFFTGHCYRDKQGRSCLVAADAQLPSPDGTLSGDGQLAVIDLLKILQQKKVQRAVVIVDSSISVDSEMLIPLAENGITDSGTGADNMFQVIIAAGSADEAVPYDSPFFDSLLAFMKGRLNGTKAIQLKELFRYIRSTGWKNSLQGPWAKKNKNGSALESIIVFNGEESTGSTGQAKAMLRVTTKPENAAVRILNIKPKYTAGGIQLLPGRYHIEVTAPGFNRKEQWVMLLADEQRDVTIVLLSGKSRATAGSPDQDTPQQPSAAFSQQQKLNYGFNLIKIDRGSFEMGGSRFNEGPIHYKTIEKGFYITDTEITIQQFSMFLKETSKAYKYGGGRQDENMPMVNVSWQEVMGYADWLSKKSGRIFRLPTEAEWEYVAKKGLSANGRASAAPGKSQASAVPVHKSWRNTLNIYGMPGNVWEWCLDCWQQRYESNIAGGSECGNRVIRGGSWRDSARRITVTSRNGIIFTTKTDNVGFRLVMED